MAEAMMAAHYPLQAMLYCVALHRFLGSRLAGYEPERHLGGVGYLFVRGMAGASTPVVDGAACGVFGWFPSAALTVATSELLGGRRA
jgi:exodeoxyribonuclease V beta subunit